MSIKESTPDLSKTTMSQPPEDILDNPEMLAAWQRGTDRANRDFLNPGQQKLPDPVIPETTEATPTTRAVVGSRAASRFTLSAFAADTMPKRVATSGNPEGRSPAALRRQEETMTAELLATSRAVDRKRGR